MKAVALAAAATAVLTAMPVALGHGNIVDPAAQWSQGYPSNGYASTIDGTLWGPIDGGKYGYGTSGTIKYWKGMFPQKGGGSMSALIAKNQKLYNNKVDPECGLTTYKESARSKLPAEIEWSGFTHPGPCEVWCDDTKVLFDYDCQTTYSSIPAKIPLDGKCANANRLTVYWIAVHGDPWQVYTDCVWLEGGTGKGSAPSGAGGSSNSTTSTASAPSSSANLTPSTGTTATSPSTATTSSTSEIAGEASTTVAEKCHVRRRK
jgi:hypothetical protein